jgi:hypothetical protein
MIFELALVAGGAAGGSLLTWAVLSLPPEPPHDDTWSRERHPSNWDGDVR